MPSFKILHGDDVRRFALPDDADYKRFHEAVDTLFGIETNVKMHNRIYYLDAEAEWVLLGSDIEFADAVRNCTRDVLHVQIADTRPSTVQPRHRPHASTSSRSRASSKTDKTDKTDKCTMDSFVDKIRPLLNALAEAYVLALSKYNAGTLCIDDKEQPNVDFLE